MRAPIGFGSIGELFLGDFVFLETNDIGAVSFEKDAEWAFVLFLFAEWIEFVDAIDGCAQAGYIPAENEHCCKKRQRFMRSSDNDVLSFQVLL